MAVYAYYIVRGVTPQGGSSCSPCSELSTTWGAFEGGVSMRYLRAFFGVLLVLLFATSAFADDDNRRVSKKQKYSDKGAKCKSVRSGNAALCGRAMLGSDGVTLLELNTND